MSPSSGNRSLKDSFNKKGVEVCASPSEVKDSVCFLFGSFVSLHRPIGPNDGSRFGIRWAVNRLRLGSLVDVVVHGWSWFMDSPLGHIGAAAQC